jgi:Protein of unknown function (DUF3551)
MRYARFAMIALAALAAAAAFGPSSGKAAEAKWCAHYGPGLDGPSNCGFHTFQQCLLTVSGIGGFCEINQFYTGPDQSYTDKQYVPRRKKRAN